MITTAATSLAIREALRCGRRGCRCMRPGASGLTHCPAHDDARPSLSVTDRGGRLLVRCGAGCAQEAVIGALQARGLWPEGRTAMEDRIVATYDYTDERGRVLFQVVRLEPKDFRQRRPDGAGGWTWNLDGVRRVPYRLPGVLAAVARGETVYIVEGEKDADALAALGLMATTNPGGVGKWRPEYNEYFRGANVVILPDNDPPGRQHVEEVARTLHGAAAEVKVLHLPGLPPKGDVSDWLAAGGTREDLERLVAACPPWTPESRGGVSEDTAPTQPHVSRAGDEFVFVWPAHKVAIGIEHARETASGLDAEIYVSSTVLGDLHWSRLHLESLSHREALVRKLRAIDPNTPWRALLDYACRYVAAEVRAGAPVVPLAPAPLPVRERYLVEPLLPDHATTVIFGDGGAGKGWLALGVALSVATETPLPGLMPTRSAPVLYLDWEADEHDARERLALLQAGLGLADLGTILYRPMVRALADDAARLRAEVARHGVGLVIVDSYAPAAGPEPEGAEAATRLFNALRSLETTALINAHLTKAAAEQRTGSARPWGSGFVWNLARSVWEVRRPEDDDEDLVLGLFHRKANRGRLHPPLSLRFAFEDSAVRVRKHDLADEPDLVARMPLAYRVHQALREGVATVEDLARALDISENAVRATLSRLRQRGQVIRLDEARGRKARWGLVRPS